MSITGKEDAWLIHVKDSLNKKEQIPETNSTVCIFGIAHPLLELNREAYIPHVISIGPYHHGKLQRYEETDSYKLKMAQAMEKQTDGFQFSDLVQDIQSLEHEVRACYDRPIPQSGEVLSWMLALDTSFVLQFLRSSYRPNSGYVKNKLDEMRLDPILHSTRKTPLWCAINNDILMLENQLPLFLLGKARSNVSRSNGETSQAEEEESLKGEGDHPQLTETLQEACLHFNPFPRDEKHLPQPPKQIPRHILDYLYHYIVPSILPESTDKAENRKGLSHRFRCLPRANELNRAGIRFAPLGSGNLREISFNKEISTLLLPEIKIDDSTEGLLRNLVALELYSEGTEKPLTGYTYLMDRLIDSSRDVVLLKRCGIIKSQMGSDTEVAQMWNSMSKSIRKNKFEPVDTAMEDADKYYRSKWRILLVEFLRTHCSKPWLVISVLSAGVLLSLTAVQVFCIFYICNPRSNPPQP